MGYALQESVQMHPCCSMELPGNFYSGARLALHFVVLRILPAVFASLCTATAFAASNVVEYAYDAAGNITSIGRQSTSTLAITSFTPTSGAVGMAVTIYGSGFSATPANNSVTFNGTAATATTSDSGSIATTVPTGATTGRIAVTVGGNTVTSAQDFTVTVAGAPTITSFTPTSGLAGATVSVTGTAFDPAAGATTVKLNGTTATSSVTSTTALTFAVPAAAASGRISATTAIGTGTSTADFIVPPPGLAVADIASSIRISAGSGNASIAVATANKSALVLFDGTVNGFYSLQLGSIATSPTNATIPYKVIKPDNTVLLTGNIAMQSYLATIHLPKLATTGTYALVLSPGTATLSANVRLESNATITVDGAAVATTQDSASQSTRFIFNASANQRIGIGAAGIAFTPTSGGMLTLLFFNPDGSSLDSSRCGGPDGNNPSGNCGYEIVTPTTGAYWLEVESALGYYTATSMQLTSPASGTLAADVTQTITLTRVGQDAAYTFTASAGDSVALDLSAATQLPQANTTRVTINNPNGSYLTYCQATPPSNLYCELGVLATTGTYTVLVDPNAGAYGTFNLTLKQGPLLTTTDAATAFAPAGLSESARLRFTASAGQSLSVGVSGLAYVGTSAGNTVLSVDGPNTASLGGANCSPTYAGGDCKVALQSLAAGTFSVVIQPPPSVKITGSAILSSDIAGTLVAGTAQPITVSRVGQRAAFTFSGTTGANASVTLSGVTTSPASQSLVLTIFLPNGSYYNSTSTGSTSGAALTLTSLPATGTYTAVVDSTPGYTWQGQLLLGP